MRHVMIEPWPQAFEYLSLDAQESIEYSLLRLGRIQQREVAG
jgi:hypothetical protein